MGALVDGLRPKKAFSGPYPQAVSARVMGGTARSQTATMWSSGGPRGPNYPVVCFRYARETGCGGGLMGAEL